MPAVTDPLAQFFCRQPGSGGQVYVPEKNNGTIFWSNKSGAATIKNGRNRKAKRVGNKIILYARHRFITQGH